MFKKLISGVLVLSLTGCFGGFKATKAVHEFNREVHPNEWVQEVVFLGMVIIPVYGIATLFDAIILNSIEFWTGDNPLAQAGDQKRVEGEDGSYAVSTLKADGTVDIEIVEATGAKHFMNIESDGNKIIARDMMGDVIAVSDLGRGVRHVASLGAAVN